MKLTSHAQQIVTFKIAQRCNLNCDYCYVYNRGDDSWKNRPKFSSEAVVYQLAKRLSEHCILHRLPSITVELHGGEPLLVGKKKFEFIAATLSSIHGVVVKLCLQTNGLLLDQEWIELFSKYGVSFSISLDGPPAIADKHRIKKNGQGSTIELLKIIEGLQHNIGFKKRCAGYLCVIDPTTNGREVFDWFFEQGIDSFDFLIPDGNIGNAPLGSQKELEAYLISAFDRWLELLIVDKAPSVRLFETSVKAALGFKSQLDSNGGDLSNMCVVESDGSIGCHDVLRICGGIYSIDRLNIFDHPIGVHPDLYRLDKIQSLPSKCKTCSVLVGCGGGYLPHRFNGINFDNPSYWCKTLFSFYNYTRERLLTELPVLNQFVRTESA